jgi:hypothetical protein
MSVGKPKEKRHIGRNKRSWEDNVTIKLTLDKLGMRMWNGFSWHKVGPIGCPL